MKVQELKSKKRMCIKNISTYIFIENVDFIINIEHFVQKKEKEAADRMHRSNGKNLPNIQILCE